MYKKRLVTQDTYYVGASERRLALFENVYPLNNGVSYNSYLILDEKTCLLDSVDKSVEDVFIKKVVDGLNGRKLDYLVDGPFVQRKKNLKLQYRGSENQRIIDMQNSQTFNTSICDYMDE